LAEGGPGVDLPAITISRLPVVSVQPDHSLLLMRGQHSAKRTKPIAHQNNDKTAASPHCCAEKYKHALLNDQAIFKCQNVFSRVNIFNVRTSK
jgi:hypothetical protein